MNKFSSYLILFLFCFNQLSGKTPIGNWSDHLPYKRAIKVVAAGKKIYCCTANSLFYYDLNDNSINKISKIQGLNEVEFSTIEYDPQNDELVIAYSNSNIDIIQNNKIINVPYIKNKITIADRRINNIFISNGMAYLACSYGVSVLDLKKFQITDTYTPSIDGSPNKVNDFCSDGTSFYAATANGIFKAPVDNGLLIDYTNWKQFQNFSGFSKECNGIKCLNGRLFAFFQNSSPTAQDSLITFNGSNWQNMNLSSYGKKINGINVSTNRFIVVVGYYVLGIDVNLNIAQIGGGSDPNYASIDDNGNVWVSDNIRTLLEFDNNGNGINAISPDSPRFPDVMKVDVNNGQVWSVAGAPGTDWYGHTYNNYGCQSFVNNTWNSYYADNTAALNPIRDLVNVKIDPNNPNRVFMGSWGWGLIEYNNGNFTVFNKSNSIIQPWIYNNILPEYLIAGLSFDPNGNLWFSSGISKNGLYELTSNGKWKSFQINNNPDITCLLATSAGQIWMTAASTTQIVIFNTSNEQQRTFNLTSIASLITSNNIYSLAEDKSGNIWIGTDAGPVRVTDPQGAFDNSSAASASKILVPIVKGKSAATYLLETERINAIAIDGGDRKWFGTQGSGAYLVSSDGMTVISHFSASNSPLWSNTISDISIDKKSGEVYFATDKGLISYHGNAIEGGDDFGKVYAYPNPVRPEYTGDIYITGLIQDANVKITDITGNLVFETTSLGGQAVWNGKNLLNKRVNTGVYLVFCSNKDGSKTRVTKLLFIH